MLSNTDRLLILNALNASLRSRKKEKREAKRFLRILEEVAEQNDFARIVRSVVHRIDRYNTWISECKSVMDKIMELGEKEEQS